MILQLRVKPFLMTLMLLLNLAIHAADELSTLAKEAVASAGVDGCEVLLSPKPVKGIHRCMQKVQEEYEVCARAGPSLILLLYHPPPFQC